LKEELRNKLNGLLGTIIFHMLLVILFLVLKLDKVKKKHVETLQIEFINKLTSIEKLLANDGTKQVEIEPLDAQTAKNIAVNVADKLNNEISTEKYVEELKKELGIKKLNQQLSNDLPDDNSPEYRNDLSEDKKENKTEKQKFKGKTNIEYNLENRTHRRIYVPVYRCESGGKVIVDIIVDQEGNVINASNSKKTATNNLCLIEEAIKSAYKFLFNSDPNADEKQSGTITFHFIPQ